MAEMRVRERAAPTRAGKNGPQKAPHRTSAKCTTATASEGAVTGVTREPDEPLMTTSESESLDGGSDDGQDLLLSEDLLAEAGQELIKESKKREQRPAPEPEPFGLGLPFDPDAMAPDLRGAFFHAPPLRDGAHEFLEAGEMSDTEFGNTESAEEDDDDEDPRDSLGFKRLLGELRAEACCTTHIVSRTLPTRISTRSEIRAGTWSSGSGGSSDLQRPRSGSLEPDGDDETVDTAASVSSQGLDFGQRRRLHLRRVGASAMHTEESAPSSSSGFGDLRHWRQRGVLNEDPATGSSSGLGDLRSWRHRGMSLQAPGSSTRVGTAQSIQEAPSRSSSAGSAGLPTEEPGRTEDEDGLERQRTVAGHAGYSMRRRRFQEPAASEG